MLFWLKQPNSPQGWVMFFWGQNSSNVAIVFLTCLHFSLSRFLQTFASLFRRACSRLTSHLWMSTTNTQPRSTAGGRAGRCTPSTLWKVRLVLTSFIAKSFAWSSMLDVSVCIFNYNRMEGALGSQSLDQQSSWAAESVNDADNCPSLHISMSRQLKLTWGTPKEPPYSWWFCLISLVLSASFSAAICTHQNHRLQP